MGPFLVNINSTAKPIISIWATEEGWHCSGCDYCGSTEKAARNHVSYKHGGCRVKKRDKADGRFTRMRRVPYFLIWEGACTMY